MNPLFLRLQRNNPFYLLSAACMLFGCLIITNSLSWNSIPPARLLTMMGALNAYEAALITLAWFLIHRRGLVRDGMMLLVLETFFLVDVTFLNAEVVTSNFGVGIAINCVLYLAAVIKLCFIVRIAGLAVRDGLFAAIAMLLAAVFAVPIIFRAIDHGYLSTQTFYAMWWAAGLLVPITATIAGCTKSPPAARRLAVFLCMLPYFSLLLHVGILHYVYDVAFYGAEAAPLLLGLACAMYHVHPISAAKRRDLRTVQILLPLAAIFVSLNNPAALRFSVGPHDKWSITPTLLSLAGAYLTYIYCFARPYALYFLAAGFAEILLFLFGPSSAQISDGSVRAWASVGRMAWRFVPKTAVDFGVAAIGAAFVFLGLGAAVSLGKDNSPAPVDTGPKENPQN